MKSLQKAITALIAALLCTLCAFPACAEAPEYNSCEEMGGATVGLLTGMPFENMITERIPDIGGFAYFASMPTFNTFSSATAEMPSTASTASDRITAMIFFMMVPSVFFSLFFIWVVVIIHVRL